MGGPREDDEPGRGSPCSSVHELLREGPIDPGVVEGAGATFRGDRGNPDCIVAGDGGIIKELIIRS